MHIKEVICGAKLHVRACGCRCASFPYLGNGWTDNAEIRFVVKDLLARHFAYV